MNGECTLPRCEGRSTCYPPIAAIVLALQALLPACVLAAAGTAAPAQPRPCRIAVTGAFPTGYLGLLARNGMHRDVLLEYQLSDPAVVSRYDLVIVAGLGPAGYTDAAFEQLLANGGSVLFDGSPAGAPPPAWVLPPGVAPDAGPPPGTAKRTKAAFRVVGEENPLRAAANEDGTFTELSVGFMPAVGEGGTSTVLAEFVDRFAVVRPGQKALWPWAKSTAPPPSVPAIVLHRHGRGRVLACGPGIAFSTALLGTDCDALILAMIRLLTDGRAVPALESEGLHLGRKQTSRNRKETPDATSGDSQSAGPPERKPGPGARGALPTGFTLLEKEPATEYNLLGRTAKSESQALLNYWNRANHVRVSFSASGIQVVRVSAGRERVLAVAKGGVPTGTPFAIKERWDRLMVIAGPAAVSAGLSGVHRGGAAWRGAVGGVRCQPVEPANFSDDFMRTEEEEGGWETEGGAWKTASVKNPDLGANPFSYRVEAAGPARSLAGLPYWDEYRFSVSLRPEGGKGSIGLGFYAQDGENMLQFRARTRGAGTPPEDGFALVRLVNGKPTVLARAAGGVAAGQWYRLQVRVEGPAVSAFVDGARVLSVRDATFPGGRIALLAEDAQVRFDDVLVEPAGAPDSAGLRLVGYVPPFAGAIDVDSWAGSATPWDPDAAAPGTFWRRGTFYGDVGLRFDAPDLPNGSQVTLLLDGDGKSFASGYVLGLRREATGAWVELRRGDQVFGQAAAPSRESTISLRREGGSILGLVDGQVVLKAPFTAGMGGGRLAFRTVGFRPRIEMVKAWSGNVRDYTFDAAPVDWWVGTGEWDLTNRWSCTPDWSWFGGYSEEVAAIWHKQPVEGDVVLDFYAGPKMLGDEKNRIEKMADFNATLCGDGRSVMSGYTLIAAEGGSGARILRQGQVVADNPAFRFFPQVHNRWASVRAERHGRRVQLFVEGQLILQFEDPNPLPGGYMSVWTRNNGIMLPRITLYFEKLGNRPLSLN